VFRSLRLDPPHGWRAVWWELAIVTLGVLIALFAQQMVEAADWRSRAEAATTRLTGEIQWHYAVAYERIVVAPCLDAQLTRLADAVEQGRKPEVFTEAGLGSFVYRAPFRSENLDAWQTALDEGVSSHLDADWRNLLSRHYAQVRTFFKDADEGSALERRLEVLQRGAVADARDRYALVQTIEELRQLIMRQKRWANQIVRRLADAGYAPNDAQRLRIVSNLGTQKFCMKQRLPIGRPEQEL